MKMKKEYIKPEAEMMKFVETEEIMTNAELVENMFKGIEGAASIGSYTL